MGLGGLICGSTSDVCLANTALDHLRSSIDRFAVKAVSYLNDDFSEDTQSFGAFCTRVVLENSCAALVGRFDPFRLLYLTQFQGQEGFEYGRPAKSGFKWTGDVLPDDKSPQEMWGADHDVSKVSRSLLSQYAHHVYWRPAFEETLDFLSNEESSAFHDLMNIEPDKYTGFIRGRCATLYSVLSKGVHWDFFVSSIVLDEGTVKDTIRDSLIALSGLGLISHFAPTTYRSLGRVAAVEAYKEFRGSFQ
jgi:hypothetical protein